MWIELVVLFIGIIIGAGFIYWKFTKALRPKY